MRLVEEMFLLLVPFQLERQGGKLVVVLVWLRRWRTGRKRRICFGLERRGEGRGERKEVSVKERERERERRVGRKKDERSSCIRFEKNRRVWGG